MIEALAKAVEQAPAFSKTEKAFNPDVRLASHEKDVMQKVDSRKMPPDPGQYNPDCRVESQKDLHDIDFCRYDPDKRIEQRKENTDNTVPDIHIDTAEQDKKYDDNGTVYSIDGVLQPNTHYELNGYRYTTDDKGRIVKTEGTVILPTDKSPRPRLPDIPDRNPDTDDRGHLIAREFGGADTEGNLVPMDSDINQNGEYRKLEQELKKAAQNGSEVTVAIEPQYEGDSHRPKEFIVTYTIDGEISEKVIMNRREAHA